MHKRLLGIVTAATIVVAACGGATPSGSPAAPGTDGPAPTQGEASPSPQGEQTLTMAMDGDLGAGLGNAAQDVPSAEASAFLHAALYGYDETLTPVAGLAADLAEISEDGLTWTLTLRDGLVFHDGSPVTADDVVQSFQLAASPNCRYNPSVCLSAFLDVSGIQKVDEKTVSFTLKQKLATFATLYLPGIYIESKKAIDASYAKYLEGASGVTAADTKAILDKIAAEEETPTGPAGEDGAPTTNYSQFIAETEALLQKANTELPSKDDYTTDGVLDEAAYFGDLRGRLSALDSTFTASATDALAAAYPYLDFQRNPVGAGPFKFVAFKPGESLEYEAFDDYYLGAPNIRRIFIPIIKDDLVGGQALAQGQVDWKYSLEGSTYEEIKNNGDLQFVEYPDFGFFDLQFNLHPESNALFLDKNLRQALSMCFDKEATAAAATDNQGIAIYSDIPPASWAYPSEGINTFPLNPEEGKKLIEASGWTMGADGIYEKAGQKLGTVVGVRAGRPNRSKWVQLMSDQARQNCGFDITFKEVDFGALLNMLSVYPHINAAAPETNKPFDAYFGGWGTSYDPDPYSLYHGDECSSKERPDTFNYICYNNPEINKLIEQGLVEFDQAKRAEIYQQYAILKAEDVPTILGWSDIAREGLRKSVGTTAEGGLQLDTPTWFAQLEKLTNVK